MTVASDGQLISQLDGSVVAQCKVCPSCLRMLPGQDVDAALDAFRAAHPKGTVKHQQRVPSGWREMLSWPGALSQ